MTDATGTTEIPILRTLRAMKLTPMQSKLFNLLKSGEPVRMRDMILAVDEFADIKNLSKHMTPLRNAVRPHGLMILCVVHNRTNHYQLVRRLNMED